MRILLYVVALGVAVTTDVSAQTGRRICDPFGTSVGTAAAIIPFDTAPPPNPKPTAIRGQVVTIEGKPIEIAIGLFRQVRDSIALRWTDTNHASEFAFDTAPTTLLSFD